MRIKLLLLLIIGTSLKLIAQSNHFAITSGDPYKAITEQKVYYIKSNVNNIKATVNKETEILIDRIDSKTLTSSRINSFELEDKKAVVENILAFHDKIYCFYYVEGKKSYVLKYITISSNGTQVSPAKVFLEVNGKIAIDESTYMGGFSPANDIKKFTIELSSDKESLVVQYLKYDGNSDRETPRILGIKALGQNSEIMIENEYKLPYNPNKGSFIDYVFTS